jgi:hypothetical protein
MLSLASVGLTALNEVLSVSLSTCTEAGPEEGSTLAVWRHDAPTESTLCRQALLYMCCKLAEFCNSRNRHFKADGELDAHRIAKSDY